MKATETSTDVAEILRTMVRYEGEQANRRVSWLATFQGLLLAALSFAWDKSTFLTLVLALVGMAVAVLVFCGMLAGTFAISRLRAQWHALVPSSDKYPDLMGFYPDAAPWSVYLSPENLFPIVFIAAWIGVLLAR
jgi:hypothetical protein